MADPTDPGHEAVLSQILRTYVSIDKVQEAQDTFRQTVVKPFLDKVISRQTLGAETSAKSASTGQQGSRNLLQDMYDKILAFVRNDCAKVLDIANKAFHGTTGNLLVHAIWAPVVSTITQKVGFIVNPGIPEVFHKVPPFLLL